MLLYDLLFSIKPADDPGFQISSSSKLFSKFMGHYAAKKLEAIREPFANAVQTSSLVGHGIAGLESKLADLMEILSGVWLLPTSYKEQPTHEWLKVYLSDKHEHGLYEAWDSKDKIWSIFSFFSWDQTIAKNLDVKGAINNLCDVAGLKTKKEMASTNELRSACGLDGIEIRGKRQTSLSRALSLGQLSLRQMSSRVLPEDGSMDVPQMRDALRRKDDEIEVLQEEVRALQENLRKAWLEIDRLRSGQYEPVRAIEEESWATTSPGSLKHGKVAETMSLEDTNDC